MVLSSSLRRFATESIIYLVNTIATWAFERFVSVLIRASQSFRLLLLRTHAILAGRVSPSVFRVTSTESRYFERPRRFRFLLWICLMLRLCPSYRYFVLFFFIIAMVSIWHFSFKGMNVLGEENQLSKRTHLAERQMLERIQSVPTWHQSLSSAIFCGVSQQWNGHRIFLHGRAGFVYCCWEQTVFDRDGGVSIRPA